MRLNWSFMALAIASVGSGAALALTGNEIRSGVVFTADERGKSISVSNPETGEVRTTRIGIAPHNVQTSNDGKLLFVVGTLGNDEEMAGAMARPGRLLVFKAISVSVSNVSFWVFKNCLKSV